MKLRWLFLAVPLMVVGCGLPLSPVQVRVFSPGIHVDLMHTPDVSGVFQITWEIAIQNMPPASGSATVIGRDPAGWTYLVTANHCIDPLPLKGLSNPVTIRVCGTKAEVWKRLPERDLALVRVRGNPAVSAGKVYGMAEVEVGEVVWCAARVPTPEVDRLPVPVLTYAHRGYVTMKESNYICHNAGARSGFSGGPVLDRDSCVVGIVLCIPYDARGIFCYAVRSKHVRQLLGAIPQRIVP